MASSLWFLTGVALGSPLGIALHELAHAGAAKLLRMRVDEFSLGHGKNVTAFVVGGVRVKIAQWITRGHVCVQPPSGRGDILRFAAMVAAGGAANLAMAVVVFWSMSWDRNELVLTAPSASLWLGWGCANLLLAGYASSQDDLGLHPGSVSDGSRLSMLRRAPRAFMTRWRLQYEISERIAKAVEEIKSPGPCHAIALLADLAPATEYAGTTEALLGHSRVRQSERMTLLDEYCTWALFHGQQPYLERAVVLSEELFAKRGREITVQGTRGSMLAIAGRLDEAATMLDTVFRTSKSPVDQAISAATLAWIEHRRGNAPAVIIWFDTTCRLNGGEFPIKWMAREIGRPAPAQT